MHSEMHPVWQKPNPAAAAEVCGHVYLKFGSSENLNILLGTKK